MRIVLDTNVLVSGIYFSGPPSTILQAWREEAFDFAVSLDILDEYQRVARELAATYPSVDFRPIIDLVVVNSYLCEAAELPEPVCVDPHDDKFIACALASEAAAIVSGDRHLLNVDGYRGLTILRPRAFLDRFLSQ